MKKLLAILSLVLIISTTFMGCMGGPSSDLKWGEVVSSYNIDDHEFKGYNKSVDIQDTIKDMEYIGLSAKTKVIFESSSVPLYLDGSDIIAYVDGTETKEYDKNTENNLVDDFQNGDSIIFTIHIREDDYGEYVEEMDKYETH